MADATDGLTIKPSGIRTITERERSPTAEAKDLSNLSLYTETYKVENPNSVKPVKWQYRAEPFLGVV